MAGDPGRAAGTARPRQRRRVSVTGLDEIIRQATGAKEFELSVSFGPGRANQKPVFRVMDRDGRTIAFAKLGWDDLTRSLVERRIESLNRSSVRALTRVVTPTPLHIDDWQDHRVAVFDAVPGPAGQVRPHLETFLASCPMPARRDLSTRREPLRLHSVEQRRPCGGAIRSAGQDDSIRPPGDVRRRGDGVRRLAR